MINKCGKCRPALFFEYWMENLKLVKFKMRTDLHFIVYILDIEHNKASC